MKNDRYLYRRNLHGGYGIPPDLLVHLPPWLRYKWAFFDIPMLLVAIAAMLTKHLLLGFSIFVSLALISFASFWLVKYFLSRRGKWVPGTWHAETLPGIYLARTIFFLLLLLSGCGSYWVLERHVVTPFLTRSTVLALVLIVPAYFYTSVKQGYIGGGGNVDFRSETPARFWFGLFFYCFLLGLFVALMIFLIIHATSTP